MRKLLVATIVAAGLVLSGCQNFNPFTTVTNPVTSVDIYRVKNVYAATLEAAKAWRNYCWGMTYATILSSPIAKPICQNRRQTLRLIQSTESKAKAAISYADNWIRANPTVSATSVIGPAWDAVTLFQKSVPAGG